LTEKAGAQDLLGYGGMVECAMRTVMRRALEKVAAEGLPGDHHFYITFQTGHSRVQVPDWLRKRYPREMTIVIQHRFWGLACDDTGFGIRLSFGGRMEQLRIPYGAVQVFADPSVNFVLQFEPVEESAAAAAPRQPASVEPFRRPAQGPSGADGGPAAPDGAEKPAEDRPAQPPGEVVTLDSFRNRKS